MRKANKDVAGRHQRLDTVEGKRRRGRQIKMWLDDIKDWTWLSVDDPEKDPIAKVLWLDHLFKDYLAQWIEVDNDG